MLQVVCIEPTYKKTDPWVQGNFETKNLKWLHQAHLQRTKQEIKEIQEHSCELCLLCGLTLQYEAGAESDFLGLTSPAKY